MSTAAHPHSKGAERRQNILRATALTLIEKGYGDTRVADVAERAGVSTALVIYYFGTREQLLLAALKESESSFCEEATGRLRATTGVRQRLITLVEMVCVRDDRRRTQWGIWFEVWAQAQRHPEVAEARAEHDRMWRALIAHVIREGQLGGEVSRSADPDRVAIVLTMLLDGLSVQVVLSDSIITPEVARAVAIDLAFEQLGLDETP